jgi:hypothetical protein
MRAYTFKVFSIVGTALIAGAMIIASQAGAIEVKNSLYGSGGGGGGGAPAQSGGAPSPHNPLTKAQQAALQDAVASDSDSFVGQESEKKSSGDPYIDLEHAQYSYMPGSGTVTAKLTAPEYKLKKGGEGKGRATGNKKSLVFKYKVQGNKMIPDGEPTWEDANAKK